MTEEAKKAEAIQRAAEYPQPTITRFCRNRHERCGQCDDRLAVLDDQTLPPGVSIILFASATISSLRLFSRLVGLSGSAEVESGE